MNKDMFPHSHDSEIPELAEQEIIFDAKQNLA
jgi:hypothetical protein